MKEGEKKIINEKVASRIPRLVQTKGRGDGTHLRRRLGTRQLTGAKKWVKSRRGAI